MEKYLTSKNLLILFTLCALILITIGYLTTNNSDNLEIAALDINDVGIIFIINTLLTLTYFFLSLFGVSFLFIGKFLFSMGQGPKEVGIDPLIYFTSSTLHGLGELIVFFIIFSFTIKHIYYVINFLRGKMLGEALKHFYFTTIIKMIPLCLLIILISAFAEVYISNKLILYLQ